MAPSSFVTAPQDILLSEWIALDEDTLVTRVPIWDREHGLFARLTYRSASSYAESVGGRLIAREELELFRARAIVLEPVLLPAGPLMGSLDYCERHDREVFKRIVEVDDFKSPICNIGKHWIYGAPKGRSHLMGWYVQDVSRYSKTRRGPGWIQAPSAPGAPGAHNDQHLDWSSTTLLVRDR